MRACDSVPQHQKLTTQERCDKEPWPYQTAPETVPEGDTNSSVGGALDARDEVVCPPHTPPTPGGSEHQLSQDDGVRSNRCTFTSFVNTCM